MGLILFLFLALDLRTMRVEFIRGLETILQTGMTTHFGALLTSSKQTLLSSKVLRTMEITFDKTTVMDATDQMQTIAAATTPVIVDFFVDEGEAAPTPSFSELSAFRSRVSSQATELLESLRNEYLSGARGAAPASSQLGKTKGMYEFVRRDLGIRMHGAENHGHFVNGIGHDDVSIGQNISKIYEVGCDFSLCISSNSLNYLQAIRDGHIRNTVISLFL